MRLKSLLLVSLFMTNIGEWVYFIALNLRVLQLTDSALAVSILYVLAPIAMLMTNSWAGSIIDRVNIRKLLISLNLVRTIFVVFITFTSNMLAIYSLSYVMQMCAAIYGTASLVYISNLIDKSEQQRFNAWKSMTESSGFILGPSIAGALFLVGSIETAIIINAVLLFIACFIYLYLPNVGGTKDSKPLSVKTIRADWGAVAKYSKQNSFVAIVIILNGFYMICITSIDSLEAAFATNMLHLDESSYGLLVSVGGIGFVIGSIVNIKWLMPPLTAMKWGIISTTLGYFVYSLSNTWGVAAIAFFVISGALPFVNVGYLTLIQKRIAKEIFGRVISVFSLVEALGTILMIMIFGVITEFLSLRILVKSGVACLFIVVIAFLFIEKYEMNSNHEQVKEEAD